MPCPYAASLSFLFKQLKRTKEGLKKAPKYWIEEPVNILMYFGSAFEVHVELKEWMCVCHFPKSLHKVDTYTEGWWSNCTMTQKVNWQNLIESFRLAWQELFYNVFKKSFTPSSIKLHYQPINCVVKSNYPHNNRWELAILSDIKWSRKSVVLIRMLSML